jgi:hypothetical protein
MALGDKIELLRVRLEEMLGEQAFIEGVQRAAHCPQQRDATPRPQHTLPSSLARMMGQCLIYWGEKRLR